MNQLRFSSIARHIAILSGRPALFVLALSAVLLWGLSGPLFDYSNTWQLIINTTTTTITFLMVFIIKNTQNRDTEAMQIKTVTAGATRRLPRGRGRSSSAASSTPIRRTSSR